MKNQRFGVGQPVRRTEDVRFLTGAGGYLDDLPFEAVRHMAILRSPVAHGRIRSISTEAATIEGVDLIYTFADIRGRLSPITSTMPLIQSDGTPFLQAGLPHLADDMVRFVGQPIAVVVAADPHLAQDAVEQIEVDIEERPALVDPMSAMTSPAIHPDVPHNRLYDWEMGDLAGADEALARADHVVRIEVTNQRIAVNAIEPRGIIATYDAETGWEVWVGNQGVHAAKRGLIADLAVHADRVRVHAPDIGGGFGMKLMNHPEYGLAALAAQDLGLPVKWIATRSEGFLSDVQARDLRTVAEAGFDRRGRLKGLRWSSVSNMGAYTSNAGMGVHTSFSANLIGGVYDVAHVHHRVQGVLTTTPPTDAYRGAGRPEVLHVMERLMSQAAQELGLDQVEIRRRNLIRPEQIPYRTQGGITFDALDALGTLERAAELADVDGFGSRPGLRGLGVAYYFERTGGSPVEHTRFTLTPDGQLEIAIGTQSTGQGHETVWAQVAHDALGLPFDAIRVLPGDTANLPGGGGTAGSRSGIQASRVLQIASQEMIRIARDIAGEMLEVAATDITFDPDTSAFTVVGTDRRVGLAEVASHAGGLRSEGDVSDAVTTTPNGCHIAEVEIDPETGQVTLQRYSIADDFGRILNPMIVAGQVHGGVVQGIGQVLGEQVLWDPETGQPLNGSFMDYVMPRADDVPAFELVFNEVGTPSNPFGVKGCGEAGSVAAIPAVANAIHDALHRAGAGDVTPPYTANRIWSALQEGTSRGIDS